MNYKTLGETIHKFRIAKGLSLDDLAEACQVNRSTVFRWEKGNTRRISYGNMMILIDKIGIPPESFILNEEPSIGLHEREVSDIRFKIRKTISDIDDKDSLETILNIIRAIKKQKK